MNFIALVFLIVCAVTVVALPRRWAPVPLFASCFYVTLSQGVELGPISLPIYRLVLAAGLFRVLVRRESAVGGQNAIDRLMIAWAAWMMLASFFHERLPGSGPIYAAGFVYNIVAVYLLSRVWCRDLAELEVVLRTVAWLLIPVALSMIAEHTVQTNYFHVLFGGDKGVYWRDGAIRAMGSFSHPILAGTVGAVTFPLFCGIWSRYRFSASLGLLSSIVIVLTSTSSGPLMSLVTGIFGMMLWLYRPAVRWVNLGLIGLYVAAEILMDRPAYYLISKIDLTGSSTGWHRSRLIERAFDNLHEWWLFGTDYTFHWMGIAVDEAGRHSDITNYYLWIGIIGGLPATLLLIAILWRAFSWVGKSIRDLPDTLRPYQFMAWCLGSGLLAHTVTSLSVSYSDQVLTFFWLNIAVISSMRSLVMEKVTAGGGDTKMTKMASHQRPRVRSVKYEVGRHSAGNWQRARRDTP